MKVTLCLLALVACSDPPADPAPPDSPPAPKVDTITVRADGIDANDGIAAPVKTLRRAIELAYGDGRVKFIAVSPGRYGATNGEEFPYTVPAGVTIRGIGANVVLVGPDLGTGLVLDTGGIEDLLLEGFGTAIEVTGPSEITGVRIRSSGVAVRMGEGAHLAATRLTIIGAAFACTSGIVLAGNGVLTASELSTSVVGVHVELRDDSTARIAASHLDGLGNTGCSAIGIAHRGKELEISGSQIDWMATGISIAQRPEIAAITNTVIDHCSTGIDAPLSDFVMTGGTVSHSSVGIRAGASGTSIDGVSVTTNDIGIDYEERVLVGALRVTVARSTVRDNRVGISLAGPAVLQPSNTIAGNFVYGIEAHGSRAWHVEADGTTWTAGVQGADADGHYAPAVVAGPVDPGSGNFALPAGWTLQL